MSHETALRDALERLRRSHYVCEDCWYSCPKSGECCHGGEGDACNCGTDEANAIIDKALAALPPAAAPEPSVCVWTPVGTSITTLRAGCRDMWQTRNIMAGATHCLYCGSPLSLTPEAHHD